MKLGPDSKLLISTLVVIVAGLAGSWFALGEAGEAELKKESRAKAVRWARYLEKNLRGLDSLLASGLVTNADRMIFDSANATGPTMKYRILNAGSVVAFSSWPGDFRTENSNLRAAAVIRNGKGHMELVETESGAGPSLFAEAYIPIKSAGGQHGAVHIKIDLTERAVELGWRRVKSFLALLTFVLLISSLCGALVWRNIRNRRYAEDLQTSRNAILEQLATGMPLEQILMTLVQLVERLRPGTLCSILVLDETGTRLKDLGSPSLPDFYRSAVDGMTIGPWTGSTGMSGFARQLAIAQDILNHSHWQELRDVVERTGFRACWSRPVISSQDEVLGIIALYHREPRELTEADLQFYRMVSQLAGLAIEQRRFQEKIAHLAHFDTLTGLPNRRELQARLQQYVGEAQQANGAMALAIIDIDKFKTINDTYGHPVGDEVIREAATRLLANVRDGDVVGRLAGDELAIVFRQISDISEINRIAARISAAIRLPMQIDGKVISTSSSIGVSCYPHHAISADELFIKADHALYQAKQSGRATYQVYDEQLHELIREKQILERDAALGIGKGEFSLVYQPQIDMFSGALIGLEALARWQHPVLGQIPPGKFIPVAESSPIIIELGETLLREACVQAARWRDKGLFEVPIAVNVAARQFKDPLFIEKIKAILEDTKLDPAALQLEITETLLIDDLEVVEKTLLEANRLGVTVSIDDFGTGYSSLLYLSRLPFQNLKIDGSFVRSLPGDAGSAAIVTSILAMAHGLGLSVVAEGIETVEQANFLRESACSAGQGYLFAKPMTAADLEQWLSTDFMAQTHLRMRAACRSFELEPGVTVEPPLRGLQSA